MAFAIRVYSLYSILIVIVLLLRGTKKHPIIESSVESFEEIDLFSDNAVDNPQNLGILSNASHTSYGENKYYCCCFSYYC